MIYDCTKYRKKVMYMLIYIFFFFLLSLCEYFIISKAQY